MAFLLRLILLCLMIAPAGACANKTLVALVPDPDGSVGSFSVTNQGGSVAVSAPFHATTVADASKPPSAPKDIGRKRLDRMFEDALSIEPEPPLHFLLFFRMDTTLTPESKKLLPLLVMKIREKKSDYITVIGYADSLGEKEANLDLSLERAIAAKDLLVRQGVDKTIIYTIPAGEASPYVPTPDEVYEPRNRRIEVIVR